MGDIADMMLEGILCAGCGVYMGGDNDGIPRYCSDCRCYEKRAKHSGKAKSAGPVAKNLRRRLELARDATDNPLGMYPGIHIEDAPGQIQKLIARGLLEEYQPHNPVHKTRAVITDLGRAALQE